MSSQNCREENRLWLRQSEFLKATLFKFIITIITMHISIQKNEKNKLEEKSQETISVK